MIISLPVHTAVWEARGKGASVRLVGVHVSSVQPANGPPTTGSVWFSLLDPAIVIGTFYGLTRGLGLGFDDIPHIVPDFSRSDGH